MSQIKRAFCFLKKKFLGTRLHEGSEKENGVVHKRDFGADLEQLAELHEMKVSEIMIPRADLLAISINSSFSEIKKKFIETKFWRIVFYNKDLDDIVGFINLKDFFQFIDAQDNNFAIDKIIKKTIYAARSTKCLALLSKMKQGGFEVSVVLDEYGGIEGIITIEKLLGNMVISMQDFVEEESQSGLLIEKINDNIYILDARTSIQKVEELFADAGFLSEEEGEYETIGGFILSYLDMVPSKGEKFEHVGGLQVEIIDSTNRAIKKVKITRVEKQNSNE